MSSPALAENTNAAPAATEPVVAAKKAKTSVEGKASPTKVVEAPASTEEPKRKESGEGAVAEPAKEPAAEPAKEVPVPRRQRFAPRHRALRWPSGRPVHTQAAAAEPAKPEEAAKPAEEPKAAEPAAEPAKEPVKESVEAPKEAPAEEPKAAEPAAEPAKEAEPAKAEEAKA